MSSPLVAQIGAETFLLAGFTGREELSRPFSYQLDLLADNARAVALDQLVGQSATFQLTLPDGSTRSFNGMVSRIGQGMRGAKTTSYVAEIVPRLWRLTLTQNSRIFQNVSVPDILRQVLGGQMSFELRLVGTYEPRNYCVQYRESDFDFASRLMEEEGIFYFFRHDGDGHTLVLGDSPAAHPDVPGPRAITFDAGGAGKDAAQSVFAWEKDQALRSGKSTVRDHNFELPDNTLEATALIRESVPVGQVTHGLRVAGNDTLETYDYPGGYAQRFDGVDPGGGDQPGELQKLFGAAQREASLRADLAALASLTISGSSNGRQLASGYRFAITGHPNADGAYVLATIEHSATIRDPQTGGGLVYTNDFTCIPAALPYRAARRTPRPKAGTQTAIVVGPGGEEIYTDKYGRVKVQFHWDREGKKDANSSCWIRVSQPSSGGGGTTWLPRIGQEVVVDFLEGDPDRPLVTGSVWNPQHMPPQPWPPVL